MNSLLTPLQQREHLSREIDRLGNMLVTRWDRSLATHLQAPLVELGYFIHRDDGAEIGYEITRLTSLLQGWLLNEGNDPGQELRYGTLRHYLGSVTQLGVMSGQEPVRHDCPALLPPDEPQRLYLWLPRDFDAQTLQEQLSCYGFEVLVLHEAAKLAQALQQATPAAVVAYSEFTEPDPILTLAPTIRQFCPLILTSPQRDFHSRLKAVRAGGAGYLSWPLLAHELVDSLCFGDLGEKRDPLRVLIVDDMASIGGLYASVLEAHGVRTQSVAQPERVPEVLAQFRPDLILMDMYMPGCNGMELASVIRQQHLLDGIPIVFLSVEKSPQIQLDTLTLGVDGFLTKPVAPDELVLTAVGRARRYRKLRAYIINDSLTGLLNHSYLHAQLEYEILRARRDNKPLSLVMIDLDKFKNINDNYGHQIGDEVLVNLARFLRERLRRTDLIGRYGGEEFAIILPGTPVEQSGEIMRHLLHDFGQLCQRGPGATFYQTFSAGISSLATAQDSISLMQQADKMLYQAKRNGRNRVELKLAN